MMIGTDRDMRRRRRNATEVKKDGRNGVTAASIGWRKGESKSRLLGTGRQRASGERTRNTDEEAR